MTKNREKKIEKLFLVQNFLKRIMSQLLDNTKKMTKNREKNQKINFWVRIVWKFLNFWQQKNDKKWRKKNWKIIFGLKQWASF